ARVLELPHVVERLQLVLHGIALPHGDGVDVIERRRVGEREAVLREPTLRQRPPRVSGLWKRLDVVRGLDDLAHVLGIRVDLAAAQRRLDDLGTADVLVVIDLDALVLERLLVELAEHELLGEVLRAEADCRRGARLCPLWRDTSAGGRTKGQDEQYDEERGDRHNSGAPSGSTHYLPSLLLRNGSMDSLTPSRPPPPLWSRPARSPSALCAGGAASR